MNNTDAFSGLGWGDLGRYQAYNDNWIREKRIADWDRRIHAVSEKSHTLSWAGEILALWDAEHAQNGDILSHCNEYPLLQAMRDEAVRMLRNEEIRMDTAHRSSAANLDNRIAILETAERTGTWVSEVLRLEQDTARQSAEIRHYMSRTMLLQTLVAEAKILNEAQKIETRIRTLMSAARKDNAWLSSVEELNRQMTSQLLSKLSNRHQYDNLQKEYVRVQRYPVYSEYEKLLKRIESPQWDVNTVEGDYIHLNATLAHHAFSMEEYISDFETRWSTAEQKIADEKIRAAKRADERKQAEIDRQNKNTLRPYLKVLAALDTGRVHSISVRQEFKRLDVNLNAFPFSPEHYSPNFFNRWRAAREKIKDEENAIIERERLAEQKRQEAAAEAEARQKHLARALDNGGLLRALPIHVIGMAIAALAMYVGFDTVASLSCRWYPPFVVAAVMVFYLNVICNVRFVPTAYRENAAYRLTWNYHPMSYLYFIIEQLLLYIMVIVFSLLCGFGVFNIIVCCVIVALTINLFRIAADSPEDIHYGIHLLHGISVFPSIALVIFFTESLLPSLMAKSIWHSWWFLPLTAGLCILLLGISATISRAANAEKMWIAIPLTLLLVCRSVVIIYGFTGFSFGMFFFYLVMLDFVIHLTILGYFGSFVLYEP